MLAVFLALGGCGQRGPLYLPAKPAQATAAQPQTQSPATPSSSPANK